jgi:hypothetical protein
MRSTGTAWSVKGEPEAYKSPEAETQGELKERNDRRISRSERSEETKSR